MYVSSLSLLLWENLKSKVESWTLTCKFNLLVSLSPTRKPPNGSTFLECFPFIDFLFSSNSFSSLTKVLGSSFYFWKNSNTPCFLYILQSPDFIPPLPPSLFYFLATGSYCWHWIGKAWCLIQQISGEVGQILGNPLDILQVFFFFFFKETMSCIMWCFLRFIILGPFTFSM